MTRAASYPVAGLDRRFYGFVLDTLLWWTVYAVVALSAYHFLIEQSRLWLGVAAIVGVVVLGWVVTALAVGLAGVTPAGSAVGLRIVSNQTGGPIGVPRALLRGLVVGLATLTFGFGTAALAVSSVADPSRRRRGWHDLRAGSVVVDVRPEPVEVVVEDAAPSPIVNLTALRLVPASPHPPSHTPAASIPVEPVGSPPSWSAATARPRWQVGFDTGERFEVSGLTLVGRRPEARADEPAKRLVALPSDDMSLSKTHAQFQVVPDGALVVMDRGSTNGSVLIRAGVTKQLAGGRPQTLRNGDRVRFGDREMTVSRVGVTEKQ